MTTWLITGAGGFLGANLGRWLEGKATRVGLARSPLALGSYDRFLNVDLRDESAVKSAIVAERPDVIVHAGALADHRTCQADPALAQTLNVDAARWVAEAAQSISSRHIHISTDAVFDGAHGGYRETDEPNPFSVYGESKLSGEFAVLSANPAATIVRTNFFGWSPSRKRSILEFFVTSLRSSTPVSGFTDFIVTSLYVSHLATLLHEIASLDYAGLLHVTSADALSKYDFGVAVARRFDLDSELITPASGSLGPEGISRRRDLSLDTSLLGVLLGHGTPTQIEGIDQAAIDEIPTP